MLHVDSGGSSPNLTLGRATGWCVPLGQANRGEGVRQRVWGWLRSLGGGGGSNRACQSRAGSSGS